MTESQSSTLLPNDTGSTEPTGEGQAPEGQAPAEGQAGSEGQTQEQEQGQGQDPSRPEWLDARFKTPEDLANSYKELETKLRQKKDDLKTSLLEELENEPKEGVPDEPGGYKVPDDWGDSDEAIANTALWETFTEWAHERNLSQDDFEELVSFYASAAQPNLDAEKEKLGPEADARLGKISRWVGANVDRKYFPALQGIMTSAENVEAIEAIMKLTVPQNLNGDGGDTQPDQKANEEQEIRDLMASEKYRSPVNRDPEVVKRVDEYFARKFPG